ncbi:MAG: calcium sensor EFh [Pseudomonadota bacterium]|jgi:EF hand
MQTKSKILTAVLLAAVTGAALSTAALADNRMGMGGQMGMGDQMGMGERGMGFDFAAVDADKDGKITQAELDAFRTAEVTAVDTNADGKLSAEELTAMHVARMTERATAMAAQMVERMDSDGDGLLTAAEMATRPGPAMLFDRFDADSDGAVTEAEIEAARSKMGEGMGRMGGRGGHGGGHGHGWFGFGDN